MPISYYRYDGPDFPFEQSGGVQAFKRPLQPHPSETTQHHPKFHLQIHHFRSMDGPSLALVFLIAKSSLKPDLPKSDTLSLHTLPVSPSYYVSHHLCARYYHVFHAIHLPKRV